MEDYTSDLSKFFQDAVDKAKELGTIAKLHAQIKAEEAKKQEQYYKLGKKYYELFKDAPEKDLVQFVEKLKASDEKIEQLKEEIKQGQGNGYHDVKEPRPASQENEDVVDAPVLIEESGSHIDVKM